MTGQNRGWGTTPLFRARLGAGVAAALIVLSWTAGATAGGADTLTLQPNVSDRVLRVRPGASVLKNRAVETPVMAAGYLCMWTRDPGGDQPHFMQSGTCPAPRGARIGDPCGCREHGDQHRGYIEGRVIAGRTGGKPPPPR